MRRAKPDGRFKIPTHPHRQTRKPIRAGEFAKQGKMRPRRLFDGRNTHQPLNPKPKPLRLAQKLCQPHRRHPRLLRLLARIDLNKDRQVPPRLRLRLGQRTGKLWPVERLDHIKKPRRRLGLIRLQRPDQMQFEIRKNLSPRRPSRLRFLHTVLAKHTLTRRKRRLDPRIGLLFRYGNKLRHLLARARRRRNTGPDLVKPLGYVSGRAMGHHMPHQAHDTLLRKLRISAEVSRRHLPAPLPGLFVLTDPHRLPDPLAVAAHLFEGAGLIYRHFGAPDRHDTAKALARLARAKGFTLLIGNDPELAQSTGASGVHWPEANLDQAKGWKAKFKLMTAAAHSLPAMTRAQNTGLDAVLVSSVFPSSSPSAGPPIGPDTLRNWITTAQIPTYGLGGVTTENMNEINTFAGIAMIGGAAGLGQNPEP